MAYTKDSFIDTSKNNILQDSENEIVNTQKNETPQNLKPKLGIIIFAFVGIVVLTSAIMSDSVFVKHIGLSLFIITCLGLIHSRSGNIKKSSNL